MTSNVLSYLLNTTVVISAQSHNPSLMHPEFLKRAKIVPDDVQFPSEGVITTPAFSRTVSASGDEFILQPERFQVGSNRFTWENIKDSQVFGAARRFIQALPFVKYTAVGVNFTVIVPDQKDNKTRPEMFLAPAFRGRISGRLRSASVRLVLAREGGHTQIELAGGSASVPGGQAVTEGLIVAVNFHRDLSNEGAIADASAILENSSKLIDELPELIDFILEAT